MRTELLSPPLPAVGSSQPRQSGALKSSGGNKKSVQEGKGGVDVVCGDRDPVAGAFVVRETGVSGELQLLFVAKTKVPIELRGIGSGAWVVRVVVDYPCYCS